MLKGNLIKEQVQIEHWEIWKVNEFNFLNEEIEEFSFKPVESALG